MWNLFAYCLIVLNLLLSLCEQNRPLICAGIFDVDWHKFYLLKGQCIPAVIFTQPIIPEGGRRSKFATFDTLVSANALMHFFEEIAYI